MSESDKSVVQQDLIPGVRSVSMNRPDKRNAFNAEVIAELRGALESASEDPEVRLVVLGAIGPHFSAGADLNWMRDTAAMSESENRDDARQLAGLMRTLDELDKPVIAQVRGVAFGGAIGLICCADIAVATEHSRFCLSEVRLGLAPATIGPYVARAIGHRNARRYMLTAEMFDAAKARAMDLVHEIVPEEQLADEVMRMAKALLQGGEQAQRECKQLLRQLDNPAGESDIDETTSAMIARLRTGAEGQEGLRAFLEKDEPSWRKGGGS